MNCLKPAIFSPLPLTAFQPARARNASAFPADQPVLPARRLTMSVTSSGGRRDADADGRVFRAIRCSFCMTRGCGYAGTGAARSVVLGQEDCRHRAVMLGDDVEICATATFVAREQAQPLSQAD